MNILTKIKRIAKKKGIEVEVNDGEGPYEVNFYSPEGKCFEPELHTCINSAWDDDTHEDVEGGALQDIERLELMDCPPNCPCKEEAEDL